MTRPSVDIATVLAALRLQVFERGWLSSNNILFVPDAPSEPRVLVDTGYATHAQQTLALVQARLGNQALDRIVNTHMHSDHCGGNALLHRHYGAEVWVPQFSLNAVQTWDERRLTYRSTGQTCERFPATGGIRAGTEVELGGRAWQAWPTPGHDPDALVYFEPRSRVLIAGDALWRDRLAIIFPELQDAEGGFSGVRKTLDTLEDIDPLVVIPGHGPVFADVTDAINASRRRLSSFEQDPLRHFTYAVRALAMFRMLELRRQRWNQLRNWMIDAPVLAVAWRHLRRADGSAFSAVDDTLRRLVKDGQLSMEGEWLSLPN